MNIHAPDLFPRKRPKMYTPERDAYLRANPYVHAKSIALEWGVTERFVIGYQRKLGLRPFTGGWPRR